MHEKGDKGRSTKRKVSFVHFAKKFLERKRKKKERKEEKKFKPKEIKKRKREKEREGGGWQQEGEEKKYCSQGEEGEETP